MPRTYLFVPPEEHSEVEALGAQWDEYSNLWYIDSDDTSARFSKWPTDEEPEEEFPIASSAAYVAAAQTACQRCGSRIEVICLHCASGTSSGDPLPPFTVSGIWAMDDSLIRQLQPWPAFHRVDDPDGDGVFANHCPHCGAPQDDMYLHSEPDQPFFSIPRAEPGSIELTALIGPVQLGGSEHFEIS